MSNHVFSAAPMSNIQRSVFDRNHNIKTACSASVLVPIYVDEVLPGDVFKFKQHLFGRMTTPLTPLMDTLYLDTFYFFVPYRLVDSNFKKFMGERNLGDISNDYLVPMLNTGANGVSVGSLFDYMGIPPGVPNLEFCAWYPRAYNLIFNEWFRDENLRQALTIAGVQADGTVREERLSDYTLTRRGKRHDYFTSCLPTPQYGAASVFPITGHAPVQPFSETAYPRFLVDDTSAENLIPHTLVNSPAGTSSYSTWWNGSDTASHSSNWGSLKWYNGTFADGRPRTGLYADMTDIASLTVNQLREAFAAQHLSEALMRGGHRYTEILRSVFHTTTPDSVMQRPVYLGGSSTPLNVETVAQTSASTSDSALGNLASFVTMSQDAAWTQSFMEHGLILGLANIRAELSYQQGLPRMFSRKTKLDFYWPQLANLGEQAVLNKEIYAQGNSSDNGVFGYQERWAEYRYHPNMITGKMRSQVSGSLDVWHLAQKFENLPTLNGSFISEDVPISRVVAVTDEPPFIIDGWFEVKCARPMPVYSIPGLSRL